MIDPRIYFWPNVHKTESCWLWTGCKEASGYGRLNKDGLVYKAHRWSWQLHFGEIPTGLCVCHHCDVPNCVRPSHLFLGTVNDNNKDRARKNRTITMHGEEHPRHKLTARQVRAIRRCHSLTPTFRNRERLAEAYDVSERLIWNIVRNLCWKHLLPTAPRKGSTPRRVALVEKGFLRKEGERSGSAVHIWTGKKEEYL